MALFHKLWSAYGPKNTWWLKYSWFHSYDMNNTALFINWILARGWLVWMTTKVSSLWTVELAGYEKGCSSVKNILGANSMVWGEKILRAVGYWNPGACWMNGWVNESEQSVWLVRDTLFIEGSKHACVTESIAKDIWTNKGNPISLFLLKRRMRSKKR